MSKVEPDPRNLLMAFAFLRDSDDIFLGVTASIGLDKLDTLLIPFGDKVLKILEKAVRINNKFPFENLVYVIRPMVNMAPSPAFDKIVDRAGCFYFYDVKLRRDGVEVLRQYRVCPSHDDLGMVFTIIDDGFEDLIKEFDPYTSKIISIKELNNYESEDIDEERLALLRERMSGEYLRALLENSRSELMRLLGVEQGYAALLVDRVPRQVSLGEAMRMIRDGKLHVLVSRSFIRKKLNQ